MSANTFSIVSNLLDWGVPTLLAVPVFFFIVQFVWPFVSVSRQLIKARKVIAGLKAQGPVLDLDRVAAEAMPGTVLTQCWGEYRKTLHKQKEPNQFGEMQVERWRATALSQTFFTETSLVDRPLRAEFYKHLPGILTGLGIIGTFSGLILGLQGFQVTDDATQVQQSLATLIQSVGGAFLVSGIAIFLAMLVTLIEKFQINRLYAAVEGLCGLIDSLFNAGAGEEYLERLANARNVSMTLRHPGTLI